jgi:hypothetical protein
MDRQMERLPFQPNSRGAKPHPHRASAWPACCSAGAPGPAMQRGGGSKLKGLMEHAPYPHGDAAFRSIGRPRCADGATPRGACTWG